MPKQTNQSKNKELKEKEYVVVEMPIESFKKALPTLNKVGYTLRIVDVKDFDYSFDSEWVTLNKQSRAIYKKKKDREYILRMKIQEDAKREEQISKGKS